MKYRKKPLVVEARQVTGNSAAEVARWCDGELKLSGAAPPQHADLHVPLALERHLDAVEALLAPGPFLLGPQPWLCDFAMFGQLRFLGFAPAGVAVLARRPALGAYVERMRQVCRPVADAPR